MPWASSASVGAGLGAEIGRNARPGRRWTRKEDREKAYSDGDEPFCLWETGGLRSGGDRTGGYRGWGARGSGGGAGAFGALAIGTLAIRALVIKRGRIERLNLGELEVDRLHLRELVVEQEQTSRRDASVSTS